MRKRKYNILELQQEYQNWKTVHYEVLDSENKKIYLNRKKAVDMYINGVELKTITAETGIVKQNIGRLVEKCIKINPDTNEPYGYCGLLNKKHTNNNPVHITRHSNTASTKGSFKALLYKHPWNNN